MGFSSSACIPAFLDIALRDAAGNDVQLGDYFRRQASSHAVPTTTVPICPLVLSGCLRTMRALSLLGQEFVTLTLMAAYRPA